MSDMGGDYNFGTWNPPSGIDSARYSSQLNFELLARLNNLQSGKEMGVRQSFGEGWPRFDDRDIELVHSLNNASSNLFGSFLSQGWIPTLASSISASSVIGYPANPVMPSSLSAEMPEFFFLK